VETIPLPYAGVGFQVGSGQLAIWKPAPQLLIARIAGYGDGTFVSPIVAAFEESLRRASRVELFFDAEALETYDSELRTQLTARLLADRKRIAELHVLVKAKLVAMGVAVANLALGGIMTSHTARRPFVVALEAALARAEVRGFSSDVLSPA
jgi:hypothetical protein